MYQLNISKKIKKDYKKKTGQRYQNLSKEEKRKRNKSNNMFMNATKISEKMKSKAC